MASQDDLYKKYPSLKKFEELGDDYVEFGDGREAAVLSYIKSHPNATALQNNPTAILEAMDTFSTKQDFLISIGSDKAQFMRELLDKERPNVIVELGGYLAYSAILFGDYLKKNSAKDARGAHVWSIEFEPSFADLMRELIAFAGLTDFVTVVVGAAADVLPKLKDDGRVKDIDLLFVDHIEVLYEQDLKVCQNLGFLKTGAVVVADNVVRPGAPAYREYVRSHPQLKSWGVKRLIMPGEFEDEFEISKVL